MKKRYKSIVFAVALTTSIPASAVTTFTNADIANSLVSNALNWDSGLPTPGGDPPVANPGTIAMNATANNTVLNGYNISQTDGTLSNSGTTLLDLGNGSYTLNGSNAVISGFRNINNSVGGVFTVQNGSINLASAADSAFNGALVVNGGSFRFSRRLTGNGNITINGGTVWSASTATDSSIGGSNIGTGDFFINGGDFRFMQVGNSGIDFFFGGNVAGNLTIENFGGFRHNPAHIDIDFAAGSLMSLTLTNPVAFDDPTGDDRFGWANDNLGPAWAEALWANGRLTYNGQGFDVLGDWATVTSVGGLGGGASFSFDGNTHSLASSGGGDVTPPTWTATWPQVDTVGTTTFTARARTDENGTAYYVVLADGATAPNASEVKAGTAAGGGSAIANGSISLTANTENTAAVTGLTTGTSYDVYFVAQDAVPNLQASPSKVDVITLTPYQAWATGGELFDDDANGDGVDNGLAFLLGADTPTSAVTLPTVTHDSGNLVLTFSMRNPANRGSATLIVQHSSDLGIGDLWSAGATVPTNGDGVTFNVTPGSPLDSIIAEISSSEAASGKLFGRLMAVPAP
jgi:hypothetical protein